MRAWQHVVGSLAHTNAPGLGHGASGGAHHVLAARCAGKQSVSLRRQPKTGHLHIGLMDDKQCHDAAAATGDRVQEHPSEHTGARLKVPA